MKNIEKLFQRRYSADEKYLSRVMYQTFSEINLIVRNLFKKGRIIRLSFVFSRSVIRDCKTLIEEQNNAVFRSRKKFRQHAIVLFFSPHVYMKISFLKNCPYDFNEILHSHSTPKGAPACAKASKSYDWNVRNIAKIIPKMAKISPKSAIFQLFSIFSKTVHTIQTKVSTVILHHNRVLYVQWHQNRMAGMCET